MSVLTKTAGVLLAVTALVGLGAGVASAADGAAPTTAPTAAAGPHYPNAKTGDYIFFNATPWPESVYHYLDASHPGYTIQPGQSVLVTHDQMVHGDSNADPLIPEADMSVWPGGMQGLDQEIVNTTGYAPGVQSCTAGPDSGGVLSPGVGCIIQTPNVAAGEAGPTQISIWSTDGRQTAPLSLDATAAGADPTAMGNFLSGIAQISSSWISFAPGDGDPISWGHGPQVLAGAPYWNCTDADAPETIGGDASHSETTSIEGTIAFTQGIKLFDTVDSEITASISAGHAWTSSTSDNHSEGVTVKPGEVAWINSIPSTETVAGTVTMTGNAAQPIHFANVTFSEPGVNQSGNPALNYAYVAHSRAMTADEITTFCGGTGPDGVDKVVSGGDVGDITGGSIITK